MKIKPESLEEQPIAFFDFDGTLTRGDTLMPFLKFVVGGPEYYTKLVLVSPILAAYFTRVLPNDRAKKIVLTHFLAGYHIKELRDLGLRFGTEIIPMMLRPRGMERLRWHQEQGHECVLVSASIDIYLNSWAMSEGFSQIICTSLDYDRNGYVLGSIKGKNCHGEEKLSRIKALTKSSSRRVKYAYGDSPGDYQMLGFSDKPFLLKGGRFEEFRR